MQDLDGRYPEWFVEGFAEFYVDGASSNRTDRLGSERQPTSGIGPVRRRSAATSHMLSRYQAKMTKEQRDRILRARLAARPLSHVRRNRGGQLDRYVDMLAKGRRRSQAAQSAFGDLKQLDRELRLISEPHAACFICVSALRELQTTRSTSRPLTAGGASDHVAHAVEMRRSMQTRRRASGREGARRRSPVSRRRAGRAELAEAELDAGIPTPPRRQPTGL